MDYHLSDSDEDTIVEDLLSQAKDHIVLEQLAAINCSSFTDDSVLPSHLESRFSKLKSFPATKPKSSAAQSTASFRRNENPDEKQLPDPKSQSGYVSPPQESPELSPEKGLPSSLRGPKPKPKHGSGSNSSNSSPESAIFSQAKRGSGKKQRSKSKSKSKSGWLSSPLGSCNSLREDSPSPPRKAGCFWCSPKSKSANSSQRKSKENGGVGGGIELNFSDDDEILSGLGSFSKREQSKILKKAMKEEEKISREAEKIVKWAKQQSARMNVTVTDDELSD